jgi:hypothetical protein
MNYEQQKAAALQNPAVRAEWKKDGCRITSAMDELLTRAWT